MNIKKRIIGIFCILCIILPFITVPVAASDHTSYSQYGNINGEVDRKLCYITCLAMAISDLGNPVTPVDVYRANGRQPSVIWDRIRSAYGVKIQEVPLKRYSIEDQKNKVAALLNSGNYPQGIMLTFAYIYYDKNNQEQVGYHAVLARKVVNGVIYCDDPAQRSGGCCIPLEKCNHYSSSGQYPGILSYRIITRTSSWPGKSTNIPNKLPEGGEPSTLTIVPTAYPTGTLKQGSRYSLKGTITSNYNITSVTGEIVDSGGKAVYSYTQKPNSKTFSILNSRLDANMKFNELPPGEYYLQYTAVDSSGQEKGTQSWKSPVFRVVGEEKGPESTLRIVSDDYPTGTITEGSRYSLRGSVTSNFNITSVKGEIIDSNGTVIYSYTQRPNARSFSILNSKLDANMKFNLLSPGEYYLKYTAEDESGKTVDWRSGTFQVQGEQREQFVTVTFDPEGGSVSQRTKTVTAGEMIGALPVPVREGYDFVGWATGRGSSMIVSANNYWVEEDVTLYAHWRKDTKIYTIVFDPNGGTVSPQMKTVTAGSTYGDLPTPTFDGFTFLGWYTGKTKITSSSIYDLDRDITLYAQWEREQFQEETCPSFESSLKVQGLSVSVTQKGIIPKYTVSSNYPINYLWTSLHDPNGDLIQGGEVSFNPAYKIYETDDSGVIYSFAPFQFIEANREYSFLVEVKDESGKNVTARATFIMPFSVKNGEIVF